MSEIELQDAILRDHNRRFVEIVHELKATYAAFKAKPTAQTMDAVMAANEQACRDLRELQGRLNQGLGG